MKRLRRVSMVIAVSSFLAGGFVMTACVNDEAESPASPDGSTPVLDGSTQETSTTGDGSTPQPPADAGPDAEEITDGGGLPPEDDGGTTDPDGGFDAGPACQPLTTGAFSQSTCSSLARLHVGGALTTTSYQLAGVNVLGAKNFCGVGGGFIAYDHRGALEVTATSPTTATFEFVDQYRKSGAIGPIRPTTNRYDVGVLASGATLTFTPRACALKPAPAGASYSVGNVAGSKKRTITLRLPYGAGFANYHYVEQ